MPITGECPFYRAEKKLTTYCDGGAIRFPDKIARRKFLYQYCASAAGGWNDCPICGYLCDYYYRKGANEIEQKDETSEQQKPVK
jgi:hypothetical protein